MVLRTANQIYEIGLKNLKIYLKSLEFFIQEVSQDLERKIRK